MCKLFVVYDSNKNAFRNLIPLGLKDPALLKALLALAARHHANAGQPFDQHEIPASPRLINANRDALIFKDQAMEALSRSLRDGKRSKQDSTVASIFVLIFLDLVESGSEGWKYHLKGVKNLIASTYTQSESQALINQGPGQTMQEIRQFITRHIYLYVTHVHSGALLTMGTLASKHWGLLFCALKHYLNFLVWTCRTYSPKKLLNTPSSVARSTF